MFNVKEEYCCVAYEMEEHRLNAWMIRVKFNVVTGYFSLPPRSDLLWGPSSLLPYRRIFGGGGGGRWVYSCWSMKMETRFRLLKRLAHTPSQSSETDLNKLCGVKY
jgi:hypothetical protein